MADKIPALLAKIAAENKIKNKTLSTEKQAHEQLQAVVPSSKISPGPLFFAASPSSCFFCLSYLRLPHERTV